MAENTDAILAAISALDGKIDGVRTDIAGLKKTDEHLATEVHRIGEEQKKQAREIQELKAETLRTFENERHAAAQTMKAITEHVDKSAKAFQEKAGKIDSLEKMQVEQMATLSDIAAAVKHPMVRKIVWGLGTLLLAWLASKGIR